MNFKPSFFKIQVYKNVGIINHIHLGSEFITVVERKVLYTKFSIKFKDILIHESCMFLFNRLLFFSKGKLSRVIGNCWTKPAFRGIGLYPFAITELLKLHFEKNNTPVYMFISPDNFASISGAKKAGFVLENDLRVKKIGFVYLVICD